MHPIAYIVVGLAQLGMAQVANQDLMAWWAFDEVKPVSQKTLTTQESVQGTECQVVNFKSEYRPFLVMSDKGRGFGVFGGEVRPRYSHFPWWNHWPVAQGMSDGRYCVAADRAAHSSLNYARAEPVPAALYGMTKEDPQSLLPLARSWNHPPELNVANPGVINQGYDLMQRAYVMQAKEIQGTLAMTLKACVDSPCHNPAFVVHGWAPEHLTLTLNGQKIKRGKDFRVGVEYDVEGTPKTVI